MSSATGQRDKLQEHDRPASRGRSPLRVLPLKTMHRMAGTFRARFCRSSAQRSTSSASSSSSPNGHPVSSPAGLQAMTPLRPCSGPQHPRHAFSEKAGS
eukprot:TRINITY_DN20295_c0_g1_i2.p1 TRINITY_DN20295_c0_g1~~TRINITY_DN20295_c0_g1_i2.p1  ORF type:complete len:114 (-),score=9.84 TRINITY_DN20295_c0_g1_i2:257-553(-)